MEPKVAESLDAAYENVQRFHAAQDGRSFWHRAESSSLLSSGDLAEIQTEALEALHHST